MHICLSILRLFLKLFCGAEISYVCACYTGVEAVVFITVRGVWSALVDLSSCSTVYVASTPWLSWCYYSSIYLLIILSWTIVFQKLIIYSSKHIWQLVTRFNIGNNIHHGSSELWTQYVCVSAREMMYTWSEPPHWYTEGSTCIWGIRNTNIWFWH